MQALKISDAFDLPAIAPERLHEIVGQLEAFEPEMIRFRPGYCRYEVQMIELGHIEHPITLTEAEISAVQAFFMGFSGEKAAKINAKLAEAGRRIEEAVDYVTELRGRAHSAMPGRKLVW